MHTFAEAGNGVPAFLAKLWRLVEDPETDHLICWTKDGRSFVIQNQAQFARELLPLNYKHNNMASFVRQLNMYGFHKITSIESGGLKFDRDDMEFSHACFKRNHPYLLEHIKRKITTGKTFIDTKTVAKPEAISKVLQDVKAMRGRQDSLDTRFEVMKQENEALWREIATLREKHAKQQQIINKVLQFLITIVQPQRNTSSVKRHMQLMIDDAPENISKLRKISELETNNGPVIHELSEELLDDATDTEPDLILPNSPFEQASVTSQADIEMINSPNVMERPRSSAGVISQNHDYSNQSAEDVMNYITNTTSNAETIANNQDALVQTISPDGTKIIYHVTEVPEVNVQAAKTKKHSECNILTTPLLHEEISSNHLAQQKSGLGKESAFEAITYSNTPLIIDQNTYEQNSDKENGSFTKREPQIGKKSNLIKCEDSIDPMAFLQVYPDNCDILNNLETNLIVTNLNETANAATDFQPITAINKINSNTAKHEVSAGNKNLMDSRTDLTNFLGNEMQTNIFDDCSIISAGDESNLDNHDLHLLKQKPCEYTTITAGKFPRNAAGKIPRNAAGKRAGKISITTLNNEQLRPCIPVACKEHPKYKQVMDKKVEKQEQIVTEIPSTSKHIVSSASECKHNLALTKYNENEHDVNMRLSTFTEVNGHLNNLQDDLESLKDLLRSDILALDNNTLLSIQGEDPLSYLMEYNKIQNVYNSIENSNRILLSPGASFDGRNIYKLFNDSDILSPYGLTHINDDPCDKKGGELMAYQTVDEFSDVINDKNYLQAETSETSNCEKDDITYSPLNTPLHTDAQTSQ